jgi:hypothetical protein
MKISSWFTVLLASLLMVGCTDSMPPENRDFANQINDDYAQAFIHHHISKMTFECHIVADPVGMAPGEPYVYEKIYIRDFGEYQKQEKAPCNDGSKIVIDTYIKFRQPILAVHETDPFPYDQVKHYVDDGLTYVNSLKF